MVVIPIRGHVAGKKNGKIAVGGRVIATRVSKRELEDLQLQVRVGWRREPANRIRLAVRFYLTALRGDLDNKLTTILDGIKGIVVVDDSVSHVVAIQADWDSANNGPFHGQEGAELTVEEV